MGVCTVASTLQLVAAAASFLLAVKLPEEPQHASAAPWGHAAICGKGKCGCK
jgi:hypothetical protein